MSFPFYIARRYLFAKKSHHAINIISGVSACGVAIATAALICVLSVFNGFQDMVADLFTSFDPELKVVPAEGKFMAADEPELMELQKHPAISVYSEALEDQALIMINNRQAMITIKGVSDNWNQMADVDNILQGEGTWELSVDVIDYGIPGFTILQQLGIPVDFSAPIEVFAPRGGAQIDLNDPSDSFTHEQLYSPRVAFLVKQSKYDANYIITSLGFAQRLFEQDGMVSAVELKLADGMSVSKAKSEMQQLLGDKYKVLDRYEQQEDTFKIMQIEKLISYIFLTFILMVACFNIIGSLSMLIIEKKDDVQTLTNLGASERQISDIFMFEGRMISFAGAIIGIALGLALCFLQIHYGLIKFGNADGAYIINTYPVSVHLTDVILVFVTVIAVGFLSVWYPVKQLSRKYAK